MPPPHNLICIHIAGFLETIATILNFCVIIEEATAVISGIYIIRSRTVKGTIASQLEAALHTRNTIDIKKGNI